MTLLAALAIPVSLAAQKRQEHERQHYNPSSDLVMHEFRFGSGQGRTDFREGVQRECDPKSRLTRVVEVTISE